MITSYALLSSLQTEYQDHTLYVNHDVYLHYSGGLFVDMGSIDRQLIDASAKLDMHLVDNRVFVFIDSVPGYGTSNSSYEFGSIVLVSGYDIHNCDCALKVHGNKMRKLCECGCMGDKHENETYAYEWYHIKSDDELVEKSIWLSEI